jgi:hypothetical protein
LNPGSSRTTEYFIPEISDFESVWVFYSRFLHTITAPAVRAIITPPDRLSQLPRSVTLMSASKLWLSAKAYKLYIEDGPLYCLITPRDVFR